MYKIKNLTTILDMYNAVDRFDEDIPSPGIRLRTLDILGYTFDKDEFINENHYVLKHKPTGVYLHKDWVTSVKKENKIIEKGEWY